MTSRIAFEGWQLVYPAIGLALFVTIFLVAVVRAWRTRPPRIHHLANLPLEDESSRRVHHGRSS